MERDILLESGTGELEILEFAINNKIYAINVIKVKEVTDIDNLTKLPDCTPSIAGLILCREEIITLIDLKYVLDKSKEKRDKFKVIICEFNKLKVAFNVDNIIGIHRIRWDQITKPDEITSNSLVIGNIVLDKKIALLLDFEKIVTDINPQTGISEEKVVDVDYKKRSKIKIVLADDSQLIRRLLKDTLTKAGFKNLKMFDNGKQVLNYLQDKLEKKQDKFMEDVDLLITDIEMPQMDGHTLTRKIKEHPILKNLPVIIFSSLITETLRHKGEAVGANDQLSKPEVDNLVNCIDKYINKDNIR